MGQDDGTHLRLKTAAMINIEIAIITSKPGVIGVGVISAAFSSGAWVVCFTAVPAGEAAPAGDATVGSGGGILLGSITIITGVSELFTARPAPLHWTSV
jgi:ABC-type arginine transport system permease subunit